MVERKEEREIWEYRREEVRERNWEYGRYHGRERNMGIWQR